MFNIVKRFYDRGIYSKADVAKFVRADTVTAEQYREITGEDYRG